MVATTPPMDLAKDILALGGIDFPTSRRDCASPDATSDSSRSSDPDMIPLPGCFTSSPLIYLCSPIPENPTEEDILKCSKSDSRNNHRLSSCGGSRPGELYCSNNHSALAPCYTPKCPHGCYFSSGSRDREESITRCCGPRRYRGKVRQWLDSPGYDDEMRKFITSRLLAGDPLVSFDNLELPLWGPS